MLPAFLKYLERLDAAAGERLPAGVREMVRLRVSHLNGCAYSIRLHSEALAALGAPAHLVDALAGPVMLMRDDLVDPAQAAALRFAEVLTDDPRGLEIGARRVAARHFSADELGALVELVAVTNALNRVARGVE